MSQRFVGREHELSLLHKRIEFVSRTGEGAALAIRGRRQVGKSRLVQEFCDRSGVPYLFWTATKGEAPVSSVADFTDGLAASTLVSNPDAVLRIQTGSWRDAFQYLASVLPSSPSIVVLDEMPWLSEQDATFEGVLQVAWDRLLSRKPVVLMLLGSDVHMMERLTNYDRPFYGRAGNLRLNPLNPAQVAHALDLSGSAALDAHLVSGGLPGILRVWPRGMNTMTFLDKECRDESSPLYTVPMETLLSEFPNPDQTRRVLVAIGNGERTQANISAAAGSAEGNLAPARVTPILRHLANDKRVVAIDTPLSTRPGKPMLYRIADSNLRFYMASLHRSQVEAERGLADRAVQLAQRGWEVWRGKAIEPLIREALEWAATGGTLPWEGVEAVGGWWNRKLNPEVDLVGADRAPIAKRIAFAGSIKWLGKAFDSHDLSDLINGARQIPGYEPDKTGLIVVSRSGVDPRADLSPVSMVWGPDDVLRAWEQ